MLDTGQFYPYPLRLHQQHQVNVMIAPVPVKQLWRNPANTSHGSTTQWWYTNKRKYNKPSSYFMGYTMPLPTVPWNFSPLITAGVWHPLHCEIMHILLKSHENYLFPFHFPWSNQVTNLHMSRQLSCRDMCKIVIWLDHYCLSKKNEIFWWDLDYELINPYWNGPWTAEMILLCIYQPWNLFTSDQQHRTAGECSHW